MGDNSSKTDLNSFSSPKLIIDLNESFIGENTYTHARNLTIDRENVGVIASANGNTFCFDVPGNFLGAVDLHDDRFLIFSTDGNISEIGLGDHKNCKYTSLIKDECLGFPTDRIITGVAKKQFNDDIIATFGTKDYPTRRINLNSIPYKYKIDDDNCETKEFSTELNCEETFLFKIMDHPCISVEKGYGGTIPNGTYSIAIGYSVDRVLFSDYFTPTQRIQIFEKVDKTSSLNIKIDDLDRDFDTYQIILISNIDGVKTNYFIGEYPTFQSSVSISDLGKETIPTDTLIIRKRTWESAGIITSNSKYLLLADLVSRPELNYQIQAMNIKARYVIKQVPIEYYQQSPEEVGYWSDENYDFSIDLMYDTSEFTKRFHIPGRKKKPTDSATPIGENVFEWDVDSPPEKLERWQIENTASEPIPTNNPFINNERIAYTGELGYFESTELYPDNKDLYGEYACTPLLFHKMPLIPRYENIDGKIYVNIKAVQFFDIPHPLDAEGKPLKNIKGYRFFRSDRKGGNKTVISAGVFTNVMKYNDIQNNREVMFSNFPYNDLSPNSYLSSTQPVFKNGREQNFNPLSEYYKNRFNYYSPHSLYNLKYKHGTEFKLISEEIGEVNGNFEPVHNHPEHRLLSNFAIWASAAIGSIEAFIELSGATSKTSTSETELKKTLVDSGIIDRTSTSYKPTSALAVAGTTVAQLTTMIINAVKSGNVTSIREITSLIRNALLLIGTAGVSAVLFTVSAMKYAQNLLDIIYNFLPENQYAYQYNSYAYFNQFFPVNIRRKAIKQPEYISPSLHTIDGKIFNNFGKQESVYIEFNLDVDDPRNIDNSRKTISSSGVCDNPQRVTQSRASLYYGLSKIPNPNQYGQLGSTQQVVISNCPHSIVYKDEYTTYTSPVLFGGDCIIARQSILTKQPIFRQNLAVEYGNELSPNFPNNVEYNYLLYRNIAYPRHYINSTKYDYSQLLRRNVTNFSSFARTATSKHNLDCKDGDKQNVFSVDDAYFYLYVNGVLDFICEADYNMSFREETLTPHYSSNASNISEIFKSTYLAKQEEFKLNKAFSDIYTTEVFSEMLSPSYNPLKDNKVKFPNAVIYSLPSFNLQNYDNWQYFLPNNFFSFRESDFGTLTAIHKLDQDRLIFLFSKSSPFVSMGEDFLTLDNSGRKVTVGDGGLFAQDPREIMPTDNNYGASTSPYAFSTSHFGMFYPSQKRLMSFTNRPQDISREGVQSFCNKYMPIQLFEYFPNFSKEENPVHKVGYLISFHPTDEFIYFTKRDFIPKERYINKLELINDSFSYQGIPISLRDDRYFEDVSWTLSYHLPTKSFISFHDWHPDYSLLTDDYFLTMKNNQVWKHDNPVDVYSRYYGIDYPIEIEPISADGQQVLSTRSIEYQIEAWKHLKRDKFHVLSTNFNSVIASNTEQISPLLSIVEHPKNPRERLQYPRRIPEGYEILSAKVEQKYRINMVWDSVKDRNNEEPLWLTHPNGYIKTINPKAIDLDKPEKERKKFRGYLTKFLFSKNNLDNIQILIRIFSTKKLNSPR